MVHRVLHGFKIHPALIDNLKCWQQKLSYIGYLYIYIYMIRIKTECFFGVRHKPFPIDLMITRFQQLDQPVGGFKDADKIMIPSTTMIFLGVLAPHKMATAKDVIQ